MSRVIKAVDENNNKIDIRSTGTKLNIRASELETKLDTLATKLDVLETTLTEIAPRQATSSIYTADNLPDQTVSTVIDTDDYRYMTIMGAQTSADLSLEVHYSINNTNWYKIRSKEITFASQGGGSWCDQLLEHMPRYVRFFNNSGSTITSLHLHYQLSN